MAHGDRTNPGYRTIGFPRLRRVVADILDPARKQNTINLLFEADVTDARAALRRHKEQTGESLSFSAFLAKCVATAAEGKERLSALRVPPGRLALFDDVHVACMVEAEVDGQSHPFSNLVCRANTKSVAEIHDELRSSVAEEQEIKALRSLAHLPHFVRRRLLSASRMLPSVIMNRKGTVILTSVGMFGAGGGWVIPLTDYTLAVGIGGITTKPAYASDGQIEPREFLSVTCNFDHDLVDGAPAARFGQELKDLIEGGHGLPG